MKTNDDGSLEKKTGCALDRMETEGFVVVERPKQSSGDKEPESNGQASRGGEGLTDAPMEDSDSNKSKTLEEDNSMHI